MRLKWFRAKTTRRNLGPSILDRPMILHSRIGCTVFILLGLAGGLLTGSGDPAFCAETSVVPPPSVLAADQRSPSGAWTDVETVMQSLGQSVKKKDFDAIRQDVQKVVERIHWFIEHPLSPDAYYVKYLNGQEVHLRNWAETLGREAAKASDLNLNYAYRELSKAVANMRTHYMTPPAPPSKEEPAPPKPADAPDTAAVAVPELKPAPSVEVDTKPQSSTVQDTKPKSPKSKSTAPPKK